MLGGAVGEVGESGWRPTEDGALLEEVAEGGGGGCDERYRKGWKEMVRTRMGVIAEWEESRGHTWTGERKERVSRVERVEQCM